MRTGECARHAGPAQPSVIAGWRSEYEQDAVFEEQLCVGRTIPPSVPSGVVLPARLDRVVRQVHLIVAGHVLAEDQGESVGKRLRVGSADAEHSRTEVL
jgi:hypothetical protein